MSPNTSLIACLRSKIVYHNNLRLTATICANCLTVRVVKFMFSKKSTKNYKIFTVNLTFTKRSIKSKWFYEDTVWTKKQRNYCQNFCPLYNRAEILTIIMLLFGPNGVYIKSFWFLLTFSKCKIDGEDFVIFGGLLRKHELYDSTFLLHVLHS